MHGEIRLGKWRPFRAQQVISCRGFIWAAEAGRGLTAVKGFDLYANGIGEMDWRLGGLLPVLRQTDDDITRSAAGRFAGELLVLTPFNARSGMVSWAEETAARAVASVATEELTHRVTMGFDGQGRLLDLSFPRWGNPNGDGFREERFGVVFEGERWFEDILLPESFIAGWWAGTDRWDDGVFFRCTIDDARTF